MAARQAGDGRLAIGGPAQKGEGAKEGQVTGIRQRGELAGEPCAEVQKAPPQGGGGEWVRATCRWRDGSQSRPIKNPSARADTRISM